jgi:hypothetical protein
MNYVAAFQLWKTKPPPFFERLLSISAGYELRVGDECLRLPWPFFTPEEMISAFPIKSDWEIPDHLVPIAGDFHDLLCVDASTQRNEIVVLNDSREELVRFRSFEEIVACLRAVEENAPTAGIVESKSWLNF